MRNTKQIPNQVRNLRKRLLVDKNTQFGVARGLITFWFAGIFVVASFPILAMAVYGTLIAQLPAHTVVTALVDAVWFPGLACVLFVPIGVWYSFRFSNRLAGPIFRINREMHRLNTGDESNPVLLRDNDFFRNLADTYNETRVRMLALEQRIRELESLMCQNSVSSQSEKTVGV